MALALNIKKELIRDLAKFKIDSLSFSLAVNKLSRMKDEIFAHKVDKIEKRDFGKNEDVFVITTKAKIIFTLTYGK